MKELAFTRQRKTSLGDREETGNLLLIEEKVSVGPGYPAQWEQIDCIRQRVARFLAGDGLP